MRPVALATITALAGAVVVPAAATAPAEEAAAAPATEAEGPIVQMFGWPWDSLAEECRSSLGPDSYTAIQVSPPTEHVQLADQSYPWYEDYQPVSYDLRSRRGDAESFANMVSACNAAGVKVYVDAVLNHMSGSGSQGSGPGSGGTEYSKYDYPGTYVDSDFHDCRENIADYTDQWEVRNCELVGLADLRTGSSKVRDTQLAYLNRLIDMGVSGFRLDGAKHMPPEDIAALVDGLHETTSGNEPYVYQEVIADSTTGGTEYTGNGDVTTFTYTDRVSNAFATGSVADLRNLPEETNLDSEQAVVFVANHDTERDSPPLSYRDGAAYDLANAFTLAFPYGTPRILSGFEFGADTDAGPPSDGRGFTRPADCADDGAWVCTHRHPSVAGMIGFNRAVRGTGLTDWWDDGNGVIAFGRGDAGFVVFNSGGAQGQDSGETTRRFRSSLPAGTYCNVLTGRFDNGECGGETVEVNSDGTFTATVEPNSGVALHRAAVLGG
ncbi:MULTISPECIES: alpha-amylase family protein [unclassified Actinopolyspora]|uniref:alpha-amylase n=1 Tax=Actinopolyspora TaxID=1849 RepID=UPI0011529E02|nr:MULTISPECIES: alpha-amylase family protein [unclassified Actinopolyspora]NHD17341.1 alpha-amylase [Actinopolyspora sp. BKK2]NHE76926.1 alpha-amylase [Actinopolyspora sp. BKK1]